VVCVEDEENCGMAKGFMSLRFGGKQLIFKSLAEIARENPSLRQTF
jgi:hypothetical protein